jgi:hypothetical protein
VIVNSGRWQVCTSPDFQGNCSVLEPGRYPTLEQDLNHRIESVRQLAGYAANDRRYGTNRDERYRGYGYDSRDNGYDRGWRDERSDRYNNDRYNDRYNDRSGYGDRSYGDRDYYGR